MADMFNHYVSVDMQTAADSSDAELLASVTTAQSAGDKADDNKSPSDDDAMNDDTPAVTFATALHGLDNLCT